VVPLTVFHFDPHPFIETRPRRSWDHSMDLLDPLVVLLGFSSPVWVEWVDITEKWPFIVDFPIESGNFP